mgnify:CR=1 FL=1
MDRGKSTYGSFAFFVVVVVDAAGHAHANTVRDVADTLLPDVLVELGVHADVLGSHLQRHELLDLSDGAGRFLLETNTMEALVEVDSSVTSDDGRTFHHLEGGGKSRIEPEEVIKIHSKSLDALKYPRDFDVVNTRPRWLHEILTFATCAVQLVIQPPTLAHE